MRRIDTTERRARLALRHHLAPAAAAADPVEAARGVVGLHASDPGAVYLAALARCPDLTVRAMEAALYEERRLLRLVGMRLTMFVVPADLAPTVHAATALALAGGARRRLVRYLAGAGIGAQTEGAETTEATAEAWLDRVESATVAALDQLGEATATELTRLVRDLGTQIPFGAGKTWQGTMGVSTRLLFLLATEGRIVRGRPRGSWTSSLYRWAPLDRWLPGRLAEPPPVEARADLVRRWLGSFGPGTLADLRWWTGWPLRDLREAIQTVRPVEVALDGGATGLILPGDDAPTPDPGPWVALLPSLDPTVMGWIERGWFLGDHGPRLFDRNGNAGPTVWVDGHVVGGWAQRPDGEVVVRLLEDPGTDARAAVEAAAARLRDWLGPVRIIPRFRTPIEQEITRTR